MTQFKSRTLLAAALLCLFYIPAHAQTLYRLTRILADPPTATVLVAGDLNDLGEVVATAHIAGARHAFKWRDGTTTDLMPLIDPSSTFANPLGTNNRSDVIGDYLDSQSGLFSGFLLRRGEVMRRIDGWPGAMSTSLSDINDRRQIVGISYDAEDHSHAFVWERGVLTALRPLRGDTSAFAWRMNDRGVVLGISIGEDFQPRAVIWRNGRVRNLGIPNSRASDINNHGQVVGSATDENGERVYLWHRGQVTYLPALGEDALFAEPRKINNLGEIVGTTFYLDHIIATFWDQGVPVDLNERIVADDPLQPFVSLETAELINDLRQIVATGRDSRAPDQINLYFLTPIL